MPTPQRGESQQHFVSRYAASSHGKSMSRKQRLAVGYSIARKHHLKMARRKRR